MMKVRTKRILMGISTVILVIIMVTFVDIQIILENLSKISFVGILLFILIYTIAFIFRTLRLKLIFNGLNIDASYLTIFGSFGIGWGLNELTPGKIGDLARIEFLHQKDSNINLSKCISGITIERVVDILILFLITSLAMVYMYLNNIKGTSALNLHIYIGIASFLLILGFIGLLLIFYKTDWFVNILNKISKKLGKLFEVFFKSFLKDINNFRKDKKRVLAVIASSILIWFFETLTLVILFYLAGYNINIFIIILAQIIIFFTKIFPITPGGWVVSEIVGGLLILLFYPSITFNSILSIFLLDHILRIIYVLIYGSIASLAFNFKFRKIDLKPLEDDD